MTDDDDARARALEENARRSRIMAESQKHGPPAPRNVERDAAFDLVARIFLSVDPRSEDESGVQMDPVDDLE